MSKWFFFLLLVSTSFETQNRNLASTTFEWKGYSWTKKNYMTSKKSYGPNFYDPNNIVVPSDTDAPLIMKITKENGNAYCSGIVLNKALGYGTYQIDLNQKIEDFTNTDKNFAFQFFLYKDDDNGMDIEISKWGDEDTDINMDFVSRPHEIEGVTGKSFQFPSGHQNTRHLFTWTPTGVSFKSLDKDTGEILYQFNAKDYARIADEEFILKIYLWMMRGACPIETAYTLNLVDFKFYKYGPDPEPEPEPTPEPQPEPTPVPTETTFDWKGYTWVKKDALTAKVGPGPNFFDPQNVNLRSDDSLELKVVKSNNIGQCASLKMTKALGYGKYEIDLNQKVEDIANTDKNVVFGFFLYKNDEYEIDIEIAKWGDKSANANNMDYVSQPHTEEETGKNFMLPFGHQHTRHIINWTPTVIQWQAVDLDTNEVIYQWETTKNLREEDSSFKLHFNFWMMAGRTPQVEEQTINIINFQYTPFAPAPVVVPTGITFEWKGYYWNKKNKMSAKAGPGPNFFSPDNVILISNDTLQMKVTKSNHVGYCSEITMNQALGYGTYQIDLNQRVEDIADRDFNVVFGFFLYKDDEYEIDIEIAKWGVNQTEVNNMDYVSQPHTEGQTGKTFKLPYGHKNTRHLFNWTPTKISWQAIDRNTNEILYEWSTTKNLRVPDPDFLLHFNFWMMSGIKPIHTEQLINIVDFKYTPYH